jgi:hypothetical protein
MNTRQWCATNRVWFTPDKGTKGACPTCQAQIKRETAAAKAKP